MGRRRILAICLSCTVLASLTSAAPQRSIQLGGEGPRAVQLGGGSPIYQQQLAFGPPQGLPQQPQFAGQQFAPAPGAPSRFRVAQVSPSGGFQPLVYQPQQVAPQPRPFPGFQQAVPQNPTRQPVPLSSPLASANAPHAEEEYDDDEYDDAPAAPSPRPQVINANLPYRTASPQPATAHQPQLQRVVLSQQSPQRLVIPQQQFLQQPQATPQQISRRPVSQRIVPASPAPAAAAPIVRQQAQPVRANAVEASGDRKKATTPPPVQTLNRYQRTNPDGSMTWGYENEDGTFKEETLGVDCVVRGKYGYVDPDGNKREYEYQQGNPCDPNKKDQEELEEEEEDAPEAPAARPRPVLVQRRPAQQFYQGQ